MNSNVGCSFDLQVFCCQLETSLSRYGFLLLLVLSCKAGLAPCKKALFFNTGSMERWGSFDLQVFTFQVQLSPFPCTVLHGWAGAVQEGFILQHRKHGKEAWEVLIVFWSVEKSLITALYCTLLHSLAVLGCFLMISSPRCWSFSSEEDVFICYSTFFISVTVRNIIGLRTDGPRTDIVDHWGSVDPKKDRK